ncbi:YbaY family lipoprotein [Nocardia wallacei]|uniref:YbaY family lipoprotein n=1 Tax=Nocardia wallacei TaxID=480035 RepID=UPI002458D7E6|nr:YbaY family lipoprotein [Nocardia wallacei]
MTTSASAVVSGEIVFDASATPRSDATVRVTISDVGRADAAAVEVARLDLADVTVKPGETLRFEITVAAVDPRAHYQVRVHVDATGSGAVKSGDQVSVESIPVLTRGHPDRVRVRVREV